MPKYIDPNNIYTKSGAIKGNYRYMNTIALTMAFENRQKEIIKLLLQKKNINPNLYLDVYNKERTVLSVFIENEDMEPINLLLSCPNIDPNVILQVKNERKIVLSNENTIPNSKLYINGEEKTRIVISF